MQKRIDLARSLVANPSLLLLDEPAAGLTEAESHQLMELIRALHAERGFGLLLVEHDMQFVTNLCPRITVIDFGKLLAEGTPQEVRDNRDVVIAYLGTGELSAAARPAADEGEQAAAAAPVLEVKDIGVRYGAVPALRGVSLTVAAGGITTIIGANGAGKTHAAVDGERHRRAPIRGRCSMAAATSPGCPASSAWRTASSCVRRGAGCSRT